MKNSFFDGTPMQLIGWSIVVSLLTSITFGFGFPWGLCMMQRWKAKHTVVSSRRLKFIGTGAELFWIWIFYAIAPYLGVGAIFGAIIMFSRPIIESMTIEIWLVLILLAALALVYYTFFVKVQIDKWIVKHTEFESYYAESAPQGAPVQPAPSPSSYSAAASAAPASAPASAAHQINGFLSLGALCIGVLLAVAGLGLFFFDHTVPGVLTFAVGIILLLVSYFNQ